MFPATLITERLLLRPPRVADAPAIFDRYASDPEVTRYLTWTAHQSVLETEEFLARFSEPDAKHETRWLLCSNGVEAPFGMITAWHRGHRVELGYALARDAWGHGLMTEAVVAVTSAALAIPQYWRVAAHAHVENIGSHRVLEKAGFAREGIARRAFKLAGYGEVPQDAVLYAKVRDDA